MVDAYKEQEIALLTLRIANCWRMEQINHEQGRLISERNCRHERHKLERELQELKGIKVEQIQEETLKFNKE